MSSNNVWCRSYIRFNQNSFSSFTVEGCGYKQLPQNAFTVRTSCKNQSLVRIPSFPRPSNNVTKWGSFSDHRNVCTLLLQFNIGFTENAQKAFFWKRRTRSKCLQTLYGSVAQPSYTRGTLNIVEESWWHTDTILDLVCPLSARL
jgi:hypothetical protein